MENIELNIHSGSNKDYSRVRHVNRESLIKLMNEANANGTTLDLSNYHLCDQDMLVIVEKLPEHINITHLNLSNNKIGDIGVKRIMGVLGKSTVTFLNLSRNAFTNIGAKLILNVIKKNVIIIQITFDNIHLNATILNEISRYNEINNISQLQINGELSRINSYKVIGEALASIFPTVLFSCVFDYLSEVTQPEARSYLQKNIYPKLISWSYQSNLKKNPDTEKTKEKCLVSSSRR